MTRIAEKPPTRAGRREPELRRLSPETKHGLMVLFLFALSLIFILSFFGLAGVIGSFIHLALGRTFGWGAYAVPVLLLAFSYSLLTPGRTFSWSHVVGGVCLAIGISGLIHTSLPEPRWWTAVLDREGGGWVGFIGLAGLERIIGLWGAIVLLSALTLAGFTVLFELSLVQVVARIRTWFGGLRDTVHLPAAQLKLPETPRLFKSKEVDLEPTSRERPPVSPKSQVATEEGDVFEQNKPKSPKVKLAALPLDLLEDRSGKPTSGDIDANQEKIKRTLANFGIDVEMGSVNIGPTVTQYTLKPAEGVKLASITALSNDLALALAAHPIRIEAPIPGQSLVGIEVPNQAIATVSLKEVLLSEEFKRRSSNLTVAIGKDVAGKSWVADIGKMPHLLIAGATGSGKSVCINSILISLLYTNSPEELKLIIVDPKRVELASYNDIPHLLTPVITEVPKTINALKWVVGEMDRRYQVLASAGKRNIASYNQGMEEKMPYLLVVIDELADLMAVAAADVETAIIRLAQMARAVGIHLIVATQRPSVDVITGLIKANITSRIAFAVASATDSRTILDTSGAEKLLGRGDSLFISADLSKPKRLQGALVTDAEIERITNQLKTQAKPEYNSQVVEKTGRSLAGGGVEGDDEDDLLEEARVLVIRAQKASASFLQRRLRVGYARAARLLDLLEERNIIGPGEGAKPREVLVRREDIDIDADFDEASELAEGEGEEPSAGEGQDTAA